MAEEKRCAICLEKEWYAGPLLLVRGQEICESCYQEMEE